MMSSRSLRLAFFFAMALALAATPAVAVHDTGKFELDGNTADAPVGLPDDWDNVYRSVTGLGAAGLSSALVQQFISDPNSPDTGTFVTSDKDQMPAKQWQCGPKNNPQSKTNIVAAYGALYDVNGSLILYFGADRESNLGDANFGFWLFQHPVQCVSTDLGGTGSFTGHKTHGDLFIVSTFTKGGKISTVKVYKWTDPTPDQPESGDECLGDGVDCSSAHSGEEHPLASGIDCQAADADTVNSTVCATVNDGPIDAAWRAGILARELYEGGINLTQVAGSATCFSSFMAETRASQEFEAELKDFMIGALETCGEITVHKRALGGDGSFQFEATTGTLSPGQFTLGDGGVQTFTRILAGSYALQEQSAPGWQVTDILCVTSGGDTSATGNPTAGTVDISIGLAGTVDCTFVNTKVPTLTVIKQVTNQAGGTLTAKDFTLTVDGATVTSGVANLVSVGSHVVGEGPLPTGYGQVGITGDCDASGNVTLAPGENKTCTITNRDIAPRLTVIKHVINNDGGTKTATDFTIQVTGTNVSTPSFPGSETGTTVTLDAGPYQVDEATAPGYAKSFSGDCAGTIALGESKTCTITNDDLDPLLTVIKQVINQSGGTLTAKDFTLMVNGKTVTSGAANIVNAGAYAVSEGPVPTGYTQVGITGDCDASGHVTLNLGDHKTCTITNRDISPRLVVVKHVINNNGGTKTAADFTIQVTGTNVSSPSFPGSETGTTVTLNAGTYSVDELAAAGYAKSLSADCVGTIALGQTKTCTITNDDIPPAKLTVIKQVINQSGGTLTAKDFALKVDGAAVSSGVANTVTAGAHVVSEGPLPAGYAQTGITGDCDASGNVSLNPGDNKTCTITNRDIAPRLTVVKHVVNDNGGTKTAADFVMLVTGANVSNPSFPGSEAGTTVTLNAGAYSVDELAAIGYLKSLGAGCAGTIALGQTKTCTIINDDLATLLPPPPVFCNDPGAQALLNPTSGRFPGNLGPDIVVDVRTQSLQDALNSATDSNGDGYIIIGAVGQDNKAAGGKGNQQVQINRVYDKPFALVGCAITLHDPKHCDGISTVQITAGAGSPEFPVGSGVRLYVYGVTAENSDSAPAWAVDGNGRFLEALGAQTSLLGLQITGNGNTMHGGFVKNNLGGGILVHGDGNTIDAVQISSNTGGDGIEVTGNGNRIVNNTVGDAGVGNGGDGINLFGTGNFIGANFVFQNNGDGINVSGGTAAGPNTIKGNISGSAQRGNGGSGIVLGGTGNGGTTPIELEANTTQGNSVDGIRITGTGYQLKGNVSGGMSAKNNAGCEFNVAAGNINAGGNRSGSRVISGAVGSPFPTGCK
jgi:hypothetical protein